ncbi:MAG: stage V sporulation T C-terminal domain-containing protein [Eubacteriales bacterium]
MKATGIVRRIDNLGRIVIPKEIRRTLRIKEGEALEIFTDREGEVILKKYSPIEELGEYARKFAESAYQITGHTVLVTDTDQVIAGAGAGKKESINQKLTQAYEKKMHSRAQVLNAMQDREYANVYAEMTILVESVLVTPIVHDGNIIGSIALIQKEGKEKIGDIEKKISLLGAHYLGSQME